MKHKLEIFFFFIVMTFGVLVILGNILFLIMKTTEKNKQEKNKYELSAPPVIDSFGNLYYFKKTYDHVPTKEDSVEFEKERKNLFKK